MTAVSSPSTVSSSIRIEPDVDGTQSTENDHGRIWADFGLADVLSHQPVIDSENSSALRHAKIDREVDVRFPRARHAELAPEDGALERMRFPRLAVDDVKAHDGPCGQRLRPRGAIDEKSGGPPDSRTEKQNAVS